MPLRVYLGILLCTMLWGTVFPLVKLVITRYGIPPLTFAGIRFIIGACMLLLLSAVAVMRGTLADNKPEEIGHSANWPRVLLTGLLSTALFYGLFFKGMALTSATSAAIIDSAGPVFGAVMAHFILHDDKLTVRRVVAFVLALAGVGIITFAKAGSNDTAISATGCLFILLGQLASNAGTMLIITYRGSLGLLQLTGFQMLFGSVLLLALGLVFEPSTAWLHKADWLLVGVMLWLAGLSAVAFRIWYGLLRRYRVNSITVYLFLTAVWGVLLSIGVLGERVSAQLLCGTALVGVGIVLNNARQQSHERTPAPGK